jgi:Ca-activated chloride channel family protein
MTMYMPEDQSRTGLHTIDGQNIALQSVNVEVAFSNLFCDTIMTQAYRNLENTPIEAVYTFPLTSRAVLLGMDVMIGDRKLQGVVVESRRRKNSMKRRSSTAMPPSCWNRSSQVCTP